MHEYTLIRCIDLTDQAELAWSEFMVSPPLSKKRLQTSPFQSNIRLITVSVGLHGIYFRNYRNQWHWMAKTLSCLQGGWTRQWANKDTGLGRRDGFPVTMNTFRTVFGLDTNITMSSTVIVRYAFDHCSACKRYKHLKKKVVRRTILSSISLSMCAHMYWQCMQVYIHVPAC